MKTLKFSWVLLLCLFASIAFAQQTRIISGQIIDNSEFGGGLPLPGANIVVKGTTIGTSTDFDGYFELEVPVGSTIVITAVGLQKQEFVVGPNDGEDPAKFGGKRTNVAYQTDTAALPGVVVKETTKEVTRYYHHDIPNDPNKTFSPYFFIHSRDPKVDRMPLKSTHADVNIAGVIADVTITQTYINEGETTLEAEYIFPGSINAAVYGMDMKIGGRLLKAVIKKKNEAKKIYETAKSEGKTASLLDQERPNVFKMSVANILPGDTIQVCISYTEMLNASEGTYEFVYPTVVGPRFAQDNLANMANDNPGWVSNPFASNGGKNEQIDFSMDLNLRSPIEIKAVQSTSHKITVDYNSPTHAYLRLDNDEGHEGNRDFIFQYKFRDSEVQSGLLTYEGAEENFFAYVLEPPVNATDDKIALREYVFVVDVSGSMEGEPMDIVKNVMTNLFESLKVYEKFNILFFSGGSYWYSPTSVFATDDNKKQALNFLNSERGGDNTQLLSALTKALDLKKAPFYSRSFIILTDGFVTVENQAYTLVRDNLDKANLFAVGIGSSPNRYIIDGLAHAGKAEPFYVTNFYNSKADAEHIAEAIKRPVLADLKMNITGVEVYDVEPVKAPDLFSERTLIVYGKYKNNAGGKISVTGKAGKDDYTHTAYFDSVQTAQNKALKYLWARNKIKYYDDYACYYEPTDFQKQGAITELGLKYNLLTKYTSFVAVDTIVRALQPKTETLNPRVKEMLKAPANQRQKVEQPLPIPQNRLKGVAGANSLDFSMQEDAIALQECVMIGYGVQREEDLSIAATVLSGSDISNKPFISVSQSLQGKVAGVQVTANSGAPGSATAVRIRGTGTIGNAEPLYVVDGVPVGTSININPSEVSNISILKDASATSIYGSRGANGVVLISTKQSNNSTLSKYKRFEFTTDYSVVDAQPNTTNESLRNHMEQGSVFSNTLTTSLKRKKLELNAFGAYSTLEGICPESQGSKYNIRLNQSYQGKRLSFGGTVAHSNYQSDNISNNTFLRTNYKNLLDYGTPEIALSHENMIKRDLLAWAELELTKAMKIKYQLGRTESDVQWGMKDELTNNEVYSLLEHSPSLIIDKSYYNADSTVIKFKFASSTIARIGSESLRFTDNFGKNDYYSYMPNHYFEKMNFNFGRTFLLSLGAGMKSKHSKHFYDRTASAAFKIHNLDFFRRSRALINVNTFRIRVSYGETFAEKQLSNAYSKFGNPMPSVNDYRMPIGLNTVENYESLELIQNTQKGIGLDFAMYENKFLFTADVFEQVMKNNIAPVAVADGFEYRNAYDSKNRGLEMAASLRKYEGRFHYGIESNFTAMQTKVTKVHEGNELLIVGLEDARILAKEGEEFGQIYSAETGKSLGNINPDFEWSGTVSCDWKGFDLSILSIYKQGGKMLNFTQAYTENGSISGLNAKDAIQDNTSLSIKNISFGYTIPRQIAEKMKMNKIRLSAYADNTFIFTKAGNVNPESNLTSQSNGYGIDFFGDPMQRILGGKLQLTF